MFEKGVPTFFTKSNTNNKEWEVKYLDKEGSKFTITKVGAKCDICSEKLSKPIYKSVRVQYAKFKDNINGEERTEFEWISTKCPHLSSVIYKNGKVLFRPTGGYTESLRQFDDLNNIPSDLELRYKP